ncbi:(d)CMP kinase [Treponema endosymbiont of Eucomonympha sp.]|uniref:(d)CMP kinase n=1 Tax=Treponema endosymbiont of Eucomonympha sp. TaxID=1580831 RepID=UPI00075093C8
MVIAIDGPAGSGKSTVAKRIAGILGYAFLNSGSFYRGITLLALRNAINPTDEQALTALAKSLSIEYAHSCLVINGEDVEDKLHSDAVDAQVSAVSAVVPLRRIVNEKIRAVTESQNVVCEGRDMTTTVFPDADYKFYLDASIDVQATRRYQQGVSNLTLEEIKETIRARDESDKNKAEGSLKIASDATYIDTSGLTVDKVCAIIIDLII